MCGLCAHNGVLRLLVMIQARARTGVAGGFRVFTHSPTCEKPHVSSLLTTTATCSTPSDRASCACSHVWPPPCDTTCNNQPQVDASGTT